MPAKDIFHIYGLDENRAEKLAAVQGLLAQIEAEIRANITEYEGTHDFRRDATTLNGRGTV